MDCEFVNLGASMRKIFRAGAIAAAVGLLATRADANPTATTVTSLTGAAPHTCALGVPTLEVSSDASLSGATTTSATITFTNFVDPADATYVDGVAFTLDFSGMCNYASHFRMKTQNGALTNGTPIVGGTFLHALNYAASITWHGAPSLLGTDGTAGKKSNNVAVTGPFSGQLQLNVAISDPGVSTPLVAGSFSDVLTVQIGATL
jgi:hypothetical protein